jgi:putative ABC transport system permease protein
MDLLPILSTLRRHKTAASLIVIEVAITSAIVCNALHLISNRLELLNQDSGLPEAELLVVDVRGTGGPSNADDITAQDLQALRGLPGVKSATVVNQVVYGNNSNNSGVTLEPGDKSPPVQAAQYYGGDQVVPTMGLKIVEGRDFRPEEFISATAFDAMAKPAVGQVIVNRTTAERLWPGRSALGRNIYVFDDTPSTVIGVVERLTHPYPGKARNKDGLSILFPVRPSYRGGSYLLRVQPALRDATIRAVPGVIEQVDSTRIVASVKPLPEMRAEYYAQDRAMVWLMSGVCAALLVVTAFGIVGLASFWVQQRNRMIGVRRALGASRRQILNYFQTENFLLTSIGIVLGMVGALAINQVLMAAYELPRLPLLFLPVGALVLWGLGQIAVLGPALRAAALPPVAVMRGV